MRKEGGAWGDVLKNHDLRVLHQRTRQRDQAPLADRLRKKRSQFQENKKDEGGKESVPYSDPHLRLVCPK